MPVEINTDEQNLIIHAAIEKKRKLLAFKESELLEGLTAKKAHADEVVDIFHTEFKSDA